MRKRRTITTTENFIEEAKRIHGDKYDYRKTEYEKSKKKVLVTCNKHGDFLISPNHHLNRGQGCSKCGHKVQSNEEIIARAKKIHGDKYDYSKFIFKNSHEKTVIICLHHGECPITPGHHLSGKGCKKCGFQKIAQQKNDKERLKFLNHLKTLIESQGDHYDYSKVEYKSHKGRFIIICKKHGEFYSTPRDLLRRCGCDRCGNESASAKRAIENDNFLSRAKDVHGERYDYSKTNYSTSNKKVIIICPTHGEFLQYPQNHLKGHECIECGYKATGDTLRKTNEEFISEAKMVHGKNYDYSKVNYLTCKIDVDIICPTHGLFKQNPTNHLNGCGCPLCVDIWNSKGSQRIEKWLIFNEIEYVKEKTFDELRSKTMHNQKLRFDFFLPKQKTFIEYDGEQHFKPVDFWGGEKAYIELVANDKLKDKWVGEQGFRMIRISFKEKERIEDILRENL